MFRRILSLTLSLCVGAATAPAALAQSAAPPSPNRRRTLAQGSRLLDPQWLMGASLCEEGDLNEPRKHNHPQVEQETTT